MLRNFYTIDWLMDVILNGFLKKQQLRSIILKKLENVKSANQNWFE